MQGYKQMIKKLHQQEKKRRQRRGEKAEDHTPKEVETTEEKEENWKKTLKGKIRGKKAKRENKGQTRARVYILEEMDG